MPQLLQKTIIFDPERWQGRMASFAVSNDLQLIAVNLRDSVGGWSGDHKTNVFVYDSTGKLLVSFTNPSANRGIAFWPDDHHLLFPGEDSNGNRDGLKLWRLGAKEYSLPFDSSTLSGVHVDLVGVSPSGTYVVGSVPDSFYCLNTVTKKTIVVPPCSAVFFSQDERYLITKANAREWLVSLMDGKSYSEDITGNFASFLPNNQQYLAMGMDYKDHASKSEWHIHDITTFEVTDRYPRNDNIWFRVAAYSNQGDIVAGGNHDGRIVVLRADNYSLLIDSVRGHPNAITHMYFSQNDSEIITVSEDSLVIWQYRK